MSELPRPRFDGEPKIVQEVEKERRLAVIQRQAMELVPAGSSALASAKSGYYELPMLKEPSWTWEIPLYFFVGGAAGASGVIGAIARLSGASPRLVRRREAYRIRRIGIVASAAHLRSGQACAVSGDASCFQAAEPNVGRCLGFGWILRRRHGGECRRLA